MSKIRQRVLLTETLTPEEGMELWSELLGHMARCAGREDEAYETINLKVDERAVGPIGSIFDSDSIACTWCMGMGRFLGRVPCPLCDATGRRPTSRGFRKMRDEVNSHLTRYRRKMVEFQAHLETLDGFDDESWGDWRSMLPTAVRESEFTHEFLDDQIAWISGLIAEAEEWIIGGEEALAGINRMERLNRIAEKAVRLVIDEITYEPLAAAPEELVCADCGKHATTTVGGRSYCKRHAHSRGLLTAPDPGTAPTPTRPDSVDDSGREGAQQLRMTRPFRFIDGPLAGELHPVPRGETQVTVNGHRYRRRGHHFEHMGGA